jgi:hypothetical protein
VPLPLQASKGCSAIGAVIGGNDVRMGWCGNVCV